MNLTLMCGWQAIEEREQAPRTPHASRDSVAVATGSEKTRS